MFSMNFSLKEFIEELVSRDYGYAEMFEASVHEVERAEALLSGNTRRDTLARGGADYVHMLKALIFFLRTQARPASIDEESYQLFLPITELLVAKGQFKPIALQLFERNQDD